MQKFDSILERVAEAERAQREGFDGARLEEDARDVVEEFLVHADQSYNFRRLSQRMLARQQLDFDTLREAVDSLKALAWPDAVVLTPHLTVNPKDELAKLEQGIERVQAEAAAAQAANVAFQLHFVVSGPLLRIVMVAINQGYSLEPLVDLAKRKVNLLAEQQLVQLWSYVQQEFDPQRSAHMELIAGIVPNDFLKFGSAAEAREKLARYVVEWKPKLMLASYDRKGSGYPMEAPSLPDVLTWKSDSEVEAPTLQETALAKSISRILEMASQLFQISVGELAAVLRVEPNSAVVNRRNPIPATDRRPPISALWYEVRKSARLLSQLSVVEADFPVCIRRYKLGLEVMAPYLNEEIKKKHEVILQRELARFALERGFYVIGTQFGRGETDLVSWQKEALYVVETKVLRGGGAVNPRVIHNALAQLSSYMDQHPSTPRGLLVIYNLTPSNITAPEHWLAGRYLIVPINIQPASPSLRRHSLEILNGDDKESIKVVPLSNPGTKRKRTRRASKKKRS